MADAPAPASDDAIVPALEEESDFHAYNSRVFELGPSYPGAYDDDNPPIDALRQLSKYDVSDADGQFVACKSHLAYRLFTRVKLASKERCVVMCDACKSWATILSNKDDRKKHWKTCPARQEEQKGQREFFFQPAVAAAQDAIVDKELLVSHMKAEGASDTLIADVCGTGFQ